MHNLDDQWKVAAEDSEMAESIEIVVRESFKQYTKINHSKSDLKVSAPQVYHRKDDNWMCSCCSCWYLRDISNHLHVGITVCCYHYHCSQAQCHAREHSRNVSVVQFLHVGACNMRPIPDLRTQVPRTSTQGDSCHWHATPGRLHIFGRFFNTGTEPRCHPFFKPYPWTHSCIGLPVNTSSFNYHVVAQWYDFNFQTFLGIQCL
jgi:hypothetical protein